MLVVAKFTPVPREAYRVGVPFAGQWSEGLNSDTSIYAGSNYGKPWAGVVVDAEFAAVGGVDVEAGVNPSRRSSRFRFLDLPC